MTVVTPTSLPRPDENELPNLLFNRPKRQCKTSHGTRKRLALESKSTGAFNGTHMQHGPFVSQLSIESIESSKSLGAKDSKSELSLSDKSCDSTAAWDQCHKAFPLKATPVKRFQAAAKIQCYLAKWRGLKGRAMSDPSPQVGLPRVNIAAHSPQTWVKHWPEEPDVPVKEDLEELTQLEAMLIERHGTIAEAYAFIIGCIKGSPGKSDGMMTKRQFRIAMNLAAKGAPLSNHGSNNRGDDTLEQMFDRLLLLLRRTDGDVSKAEFLRFSDLLSREKALQELAADANNELLIGSRLLDRLTSIKSSQDALEVFQKTVVALQLEPARTTNMLYQIAMAPGGPSGLTSVLSKITRIAQQFGGPNQDVRLDVLLATWKLCAALAKQVKALGVPPAQSVQSSSSQNKPVKTTSTLTSTVKAASKFRKNYKVKVDVSLHPPRDDKLEHECNEAFWQVLPPGEVLWNLSCGAEALNDEGFKKLVSTAWDIFDDFDGVVCLLGPVGWGRMRPKLDALLAMNLETHVLGKDPEHAYSQLQNAGVLLQQIASMCQADPRLARIAGLFGASFLADRICSKANASVNFADGAVGSAVAHVNRSAAAITHEVSFHVEELLGGCKVECSLSGGQYKIVHAADNANPLAEWHKDITAQVLAKATPKGDIARPSSEEPGSLHATSKFLAGYSNLQGL